VRRPLPPSALRLFYLAVAALVILCDRLSKTYIRGHLVRELGSIQVIPHFFSITHVENTGAAFSMMADWPQSVRAPLLIGFSVFASLLVCYMLWKSARRFTWTGFAMALILGGAAGNLYDRVRYGHVTDFLHFYIGAHVWPDFNIADSAIVVGSTLLVIDLLMGHDFSQDH
jgi:signal peptidase II